MDRIMFLQSIPPVQLLALAAFLYVLLRVIRRSNKLLPPGPRGYPVIGNLLHVPDRAEWKAYKEMSQKYNSDIIYLNLFGTSLIVVNSLEIAQDLFEKRSSIYSDRPRMPMLNELIGFDWHFAFMPYGESWKEHRKLFHKEFQPPATLLHRPRELEATRKMLLKLLEKPEDYTQHLRHMSGMIILSTAYGINVQPENDPYVDISEKSVNAIACAGNLPSYLVDQVPALKYVPEWIPGASFKRQAREWRKLARALPIVPIDFVKRSMNDGTAKSSIASRLFGEMDENGTRSPEKEELLSNVLGAIYVAGSDTTVATLEVFILAMMQNPEIQKKGQKAVDDAVGKDRLPDFSDHKSIPYIDALLKEVLRWQPITPLAAPHSVTADDEYRGYHIPSGSIVVGNAWAMLYDESIYGPNPQLFNPERFMKDGYLNADIKHPDMLFGFGRRQCPGMDMAESSIWITMASILACFDIVKVVDENGVPIEFSGNYTSGMVCRPQPFKCSFVPRSPHAETLIKDGLHHETF